jgi:hypothetical protein
MPVATAVLGVTVSDDDVRASRGAVPLSIIDLPAFEVIFTTLHGSPPCDGLPGREFPGWKQRFTFEC